MSAESEHTFPGTILDADLQNGLGSVNSGAAGAAGGSRDGRPETGENLSDRIR